MQRSVVALLKELVALPSVNPDHTDDPDVANEYRVTDYLARHFEARGWRVEWDHVTPERANLIASYGPENPRYTLLLEAHTDTVGVTGMTVAPFTPVEKEGRLYGRGSCDTKGPMAAALAALTPETVEALAAAGVRILFVGAYGEEKGNIGAERLAEQGLGADSALILEPTELAIVHAHKGTLWLELTVWGRAGHGSDPEKGTNAIVAMADIVRWLQEQIKRQQIAAAHPDLGRPTLNIGRIDGGVAVNIVAQRCCIEIDRRTVPGEDGEQLVNDIRDRCDALKESGALCDFDLRIIKAGIPFSTGKDAGLVNQMASALEKAGPPARLATAAWYSDAGAFSRTCREVVVFGPGSIQQAHTADEYIDLDQLRAGQDVLSAFFAELARDQAAAGER